VVSQEMGGSLGFNQSLKPSNSLQRSVRCAEDAGTRALQRSRLVGHPGELLPAALPHIPIDIIVELETARQREQNGASLLKCRFDLLALGPISLLMNNAISLLADVCVCNRPRLEGVALACPAQRGEPRIRRPRLGPIASGKPRRGLTIGYSNNLLCWRSLSSCSRMYFRTDPSSRPTVLTQYPVAQKCIPAIRRSFSNSRWILTALFPFRNPIVYATLYFGGMLKHRCT
jgi:hypothetical protein